MLGIGIFGSWALGCGWDPRLRHGLQKPGLAAAETTFKDLEWN